MAASFTARFGLGPSSRVLEIASNDGYLLKFFVARAIRCWAWSRRATSPRWPTRAASRR
jgi:hypothetical protein